MKKRIGSVLFFCGALSGAVMVYGAQEFFGGPLTTLLAIACVISSYGAGFVEGHVAANKGRKGG